jgi:hypothetical protein
MVREYFGMLSFCIAGLVLMAAAVMAYVIPASVWLQVHDVRVFDAKVGSPVQMVVARTIKLDFNGTWVAGIRRLEPDGWTLYCPASGSAPYRTDSVLPNPLTLAWWTFPDCSKPFPPGKYQMRTTWTIQGDGFFPDKTVTADSNIFEILP